MRFGHLTSRTPARADAEFLADLYASTRTDLQHIPVPRDVITAIIRHQHQLQATDYADRFPHAEYHLIEHDGAPVGRAVLNRNEGELLVVDLSIARHARRRGHARAVLKALQECATREGYSLTLRVRTDNAGARALYASLGFTVVATDEIAQQMRWTPPAA